MSRPRAPRSHGSRADLEIDDDGRGARRPPSADTLLENLPVCERRQLMRRAPTRPRRQPVLKDAEVAEVLEKSIEILGHRLAPATLDQTAPIVHQFRGFAAHQESPVYRTLPLDMQIVVWITLKMQRRS